MLSDKLFGTFLGMEFREDVLVVSFLKNGISGMGLVSSSSFPLKTDEGSLLGVREYINRQGLKPNKVFVSIPDKWVIAKVIGVPSVKGKGKDAVLNMMRFEIERHIPFNIEEVSFDFLVVGKKDQAYSVVFVAAHREKMDYITGYLEKLSLRPDTVIPSSFAVLNTIELSGVAAGGLMEVTGLVRKSKVLGKGGGINVALYFDGTHAGASALKDGLYSYHRSFPGMAGQGPGDILNDITRCVVEICSGFQAERPAKLILAGDLAPVRDIIDELKEKTGTDIITLDRISDFSAIAASAGACFAGLGMATYTINLLPHKMKLDTRKAVPISTVLLSALILVLAVGIFATEAVKRKKYLERIEEELKKNGPMIEEIEKLSSGINGLQERIDALGNVKRSDIALELMAEISGLMPKDAWITNFEYRIFEPGDGKKGAGELVISGFAASSSALIPVLEDSPYLEKVALAGPVKKAGDKEQFKLSAHVVPPEEKKEKSKT